MVGAGKGPDVHRSTVDGGPVEDRDPDVVPLHLFIQGKGEGSQWKWRWRRGERRQMMKMRMHREKRSSGHL